MNSDQLRIALVISALIGIIGGVVGYVSLVGAMAQSVPLQTTLEPTRYPMLPSREPTHTPTPRPTLALFPTETAAPLEELMTGWVVILGRYESAENARSVLFPDYPVTLFLRGDVYQPAIPGFDTLAEARPVLRLVREERPEAYVRDLRVWCPAQAAAQIAAQDEQAEIVVCGRAE